VRQCENSHLDKNDREIGHLRTDAKNAKMRSFARDKNDRQVLKIGSFSTTICFIVIIFSKNAILRNSKQGTEGTFLQIYDWPNMSV
jgi:hypothetical protein